MKYREAATWSELNTMEQQKYDLWEKAEPVVSAIRIFTAGMCITKLSDYTGAATQLLVRVPRLIR
jgi:hypothetical protein